MNDKVIQNDDLKRIWRDFVNMSRGFPFLWNKLQQCGWKA